MARTYRTLTDVLTTQQYSVVSTLMGVLTTQLYMVVSTLTGVLTTQQYSVVIRTKIPYSVIK